MSDKSAPQPQLRLEWVYGYRGHQCRNNLYYTASKEVVYFTAGVGVVYNPKENRQKFFLGHDDDIISLALHPQRVLVATGQIGKQPYICIWNTLSLQTISILKDGHTHGIGAVGFDKQGIRLVSVGLDTHATINVWDVKRGKVLATTRGHSDRVLDVQFHSCQDNLIVSCGVKHIKFWSLCGNNLQPKKGVFGKVGEIQTMLCLAFGPEDITYAGTLSGDIYIWHGNQLQRLVQAAHKGGVFTLQSADEGFASGGKDGLVKLWDTDLKHISTFDLTKSSEGYDDLIVRAVCWYGEHVLAGTQDSEIFELTLSDRNSPRCLVQGHAEGELWGLAVHPKKALFATASDDCTLRIWSIQDRSLISKTTLEHPIRSCGFSPDGSQIAVGMTDGSFMVLRVRDFQRVFHLKERKEVIHELKFSPSGEYLAVGSNDNFVDIYAVPQRFKKVGQCSGSSSFITHVDWSEDSKYLQTNSGAAERLFYRMPAGKQVTGKEEIQAVRWATWTGVLGPEAHGIWPKYTDTNDVNASDANFTAEVMVTGDDFGMVKLFRFPSLKKGAKFRKYVGHSAHVTNVRFSSDKTKVITTGGADQSIFQWAFLPPGLENGYQDDMAGQAYMDSNSEDSDSDSSDVPEVDSDLEVEKQRNYDRLVCKEDASLVRAQAKANLQAGHKRPTAPSEGLKMTYVHGYRGYDCRNNLFYLQTGAVVYHVAGVGIILDKTTHKQRFYLQHTDDILCLCVHHAKDIVATGQVGRDAAIHVWEADTLKTLSILKGQHQRGVCAVDFSSDGRKLASVGLDNDHMVVLWDWRRGEKLASARGHKDKIYVIKWNPLEENQLVTVGDKHLKFWTQAGGGLTSTRGKFGNVAKIDSMMCVVFGKTSDMCYTGGASGNIFIWIAQELKKTVKAHEGPIFAMHSLDKGFVSGGKDGVVSLWDDSFERSLKSYRLKRTALSPGSKGVMVHEHAAVRSVVLGYGHILVGTVSGDVMELSKDGAITILSQGHGEGEVWGLATHPSLLGCATVGDDKTLRVWDLVEHKMINCKVLKKPGRSVCFSPDGKAIAVGLKDGSFVVVKTDTLEDVVQFHHRKEEISDLKFSPDPGKYLAVASHDNFVDIYNVLSSKRVGVCKGSSSYITHIDWDKTGRLLVVNSGAKEQLFFEAPRGKRITLGEKEMEKMPWASWTGVLGHVCEGIWPQGSDVTDVNSAAKSHSGTVVATGDDLGFVKLFTYPAKGKFSKYRQYSGHSSHVTCVRWTHDDSHLLSVGGGDTALVLWSHEGGEARTNGDSEDSDIDSEEEGGYDSDVAHEKSIDYKKKTYVNPIRETGGVRPQNREYEEMEKPAVSRQTREITRVKSSHSAPANQQKGQRRSLGKVKELELETIFGYRGFDCRNNAHFVNDGADVVYHAAGAGIVQNLATGQQSFYLQHNDDILCLTVNENPKFKNIVATGQIAVVPEVHVWDITTKKTLSVLKGAHGVGICSIDFSCSGKLLVSIGLDEQHTVAVWRWQEGALVAKTQGHSDRIFHVEFRPDTDSRFVTVGVKHVKFWSIAGSELIGKNGILAHVAEVAATPKMTTMLSVAFGANEVTYTGAMSGDVYVWQEGRLVRLVLRAHHGPIFTMFTTLRDGLILTGAKEKSSKEGGAVKLWDQEMRRSRSFTVNPSARKCIVKSATRHKGSILVGTHDGDVVQVVEKSGEMRVLLNGHGEGELWGLATHPSSQRCITASEDGTVRLWDITAKKLLFMLAVGPAKSADISSSGEHAAVGLKNGGFILLQLATFQKTGQGRDRGTQINSVKFSPDSRWLAVGAEEGTVDIYEVGKGQGVRRVSYCKGIRGFVDAMDFSVDSLYLRVSTGAYEKQVFEIPKSVEVTRKELLPKITYHSWTSVVGPEVVGIWPKNADKADVNTACVSHTGNAVATGDDHGCVNLYDFPCPEKYATHTTYYGHSAHVTCVRFTAEDRHVVSAGGDDSCVFVWKCK